MCRILSEVHFLVLLQLKRNRKKVKHRQRKVHDRGKSTGCLKEIKILCADFGWERKVYIRNNL